MKYSNRGKVECVNIDIVDRQKWFERFNVFFVDFCVLLEEEEEMKFFINLG